MSVTGSHLIRVEDLPLELEEQFFPFVFKIESGLVSLNSKWRQMNFVICLAFLEPSTRTRMSFHMAGQRMGLQVNVFDHSFSSLAKGETLEDTLINIDRLKPDLLVVRCPEELNLLKFSERPLYSSIINGGWGSVEHPSQALLDAYTLWKHFGSLKGLKVLLMGDLRHSRVASSNWGLLRKLGCEVGSFGPPKWAPAEKTGIITFDSRAEALSWADACMALRVQTERHHGDVEMSAEEYLAQYGLSDEALKDLRASAVLLHPGPVNRGVEISEKAYIDSRSKILEQVEGGLYVRMALFDFILNQRLLT